jgi:predicted Zn-dependent peptidase
MHRSVLTVIVGFLLCSTTYGQSTESVGSKTVESLKFKDITWDIPQLGKDVKVDTLKNGILLFMLEDHRLPTLSVNTLVRTGSIYEPTEKRGLASLTGAVMRTGGTGTLSPDKLNEEVEYIAASIETWIGDESGGARLNCMSKDTEKGLTLLADVLMNPAFQQDQIDLQKNKIKEGIRRRNDSPSAICSREWSHLIYGDHVYGSILEWEPVKSILREDMVAFHDKYFHPENVWLGISGDFHVATIVPVLERVFGSWSGDVIEFPETASVENKPNPGVFLIDRDVTQSNITFGLLGVNQYNPDRYAIAIMNYILGGGSFTSRMTTEVRSNLGLAYTVTSSFGTNSVDLGTFSAFCQTKTETTHKAISEMIEQIELMRTEEVADYELNSAKDAFINRFVFNFTNPASIVSQLMELEYENMPGDFYQKYLDKIRAVTKKDVLAVAQKYLLTDQMTFVVVGKASGFEGPMDSFGKTSVLELKDPMVE